MNTYEHCPADHIVSIRGATVENRPDGPVLLISSGQVLTIEFVEDLQSEGDLADTGPHPPGAAGQDRGGPDHDHGTHRSWAPHSPSKVQPDAAAFGRNRSRSPRQALSVGEPVSAAMTKVVAKFAGFTPLEVASDRVAMCFDVFCQDALSPSRHPCTTVLSLARHCDQRFSLTTKAGAAVQGCAPAFCRYKLLQDPDRGHTRADIAVQGAREAAQILGVRWPTNPEQPLWFPDVDDASDSFDTAHIGEEVVAATFCLFTPDYHPEVIPMHIAIPQTFLDIVDLLQTCCDRSHTALFPRIVEIWPQPSATWGALLAVPDWKDRMPVICVDCMALDGRLFAAVAPTRANRHQLLQIAGLSPVAEAEVFLPDNVLPLEADRDVALWTGLCVRITRRGHFPPTDLSLREMLRSTRLWAVRPNLDFIGIAEHYCIVTHNGQRAFRLLPHRALYYRTDLATQFGYAAATMHFQPASPLVVNATVFGRPCRTVVVLDDKPDDPWDAEPVSGLLDCRPMLLGWLPLHSDQGWVDLELLRDALTQSAPPQWAASFINFPDHWTWTWIEPGQVIVAHFVPHGARIPLPLITPVIPRSAPDGLDEVSSAAGGTPIDEPDEATPGSAADGPVQALRTSSGLDTMDALRIRTDPDIRTVAPDISSGKVCRRIIRPVHGHSGAQSFLFVGVLFSTCSLNRAAPLLHCPGAVLTPSGAASSAYASSPPLAVGPAADLVLPGSGTGSDHFTAHWARSYLAGKPLPPQSDSAQHYQHYRRVAPTPCRGLPMPLDITYVWHLEVLDTLLDESAHTADDWAFLTVTLLEVLTEHFDSSLPAALPTQPASAPGTTHQKIDGAPALAVRLEACLPLSEHQRQCLGLEKSLPHVMPPEEHDWLDSDLSDVLRFEGLSLDIRTQLVNVSSWHHTGCPPADQLVIFTDGSASSGPSDISPCAWAFAVFVVSGSRMLLLGHSSGQSVPPNTPFYLGEQVDDALTAELLALCWALCWASQFAAAYTCPVSFRYDAISAGGGTFGASQAVGSSQPNAYTALAQFAVALRQYIAVRVSLSHEHVTGHSGNLGNELCDGLAKLARRTPSSPFNCCLPAWPARWAAHPLSDWAWATVPGQPDIPRLYCFETEVQLAQAVPSPAVPAPTFGLQEYNETAGETQCVWSCITFNALTLRDKPCGGRPATAHSTGLRLVGRKDFLKDSLRDHRPLFIGLQETRLATAEMQPDPDYFILNAAATDRGVGGCALWIAKNLPFYTTTAGPTYVRPQDITVTAASHRHLVVALQTPRIKLQVHVIHAPSTHTTPLEEVKAFWDLRAREVLTRADGTDFLVLCDANSRLGDVVSEHVSDHGADVEGNAGALFHSFLTTIDAIAPATWACYHRGAHVTWCSALGGWSRIDYVLVPRRWRHVYMESRTLPDVELLQLREDHIPVHCHLLCRFARASPPLYYSQATKQVLRPDPLIQAITPVTWTVPVDSHYAQLVQAWTHVDACLQQPPARVPRQPYLTAATLDLVAERRALRLYLRADRTERDRRWFLLVFAAFLTNCRGASFSHAQLSVADRWFRDMDRSEAVALANYRRLARALRRAVAIDRTAYLDSLAAEVVHHSLRDPKELYKALRKAFPAARSARRASIQPLPMLTLADGTAALSTAARAEAWRAHFILRPCERGVRPCILGCLILGVCCVETSMLIVLLLFFFFLLLHVQKRTALVTQRIDLSMYSRCTVHAFDKTPWQKIEKTICN